MKKSYSTLHLSNNLKKLIELKSIKDGKKFTASQLASKLGMQRSQIARLLTENATLKVENPKLNTLFEIITFFEESGLNVSLDNLFESEPDFT